MNYSINNDLWIACVIIVSYIVEENKLTSNDDAKNTHTHTLTIEREKHAHTHRFIAVLSLNRHNLTIIRVLIEFVPLVYVINFDSTL